MDKTFEEAAIRLGVFDGIACGSIEHVAEMLHTMRYSWSDFGNNDYWRMLYEDALKISGLVCDEVVATVIRKQHDYGHDNILAFGIQGIIVRVSDKWARIENLTSRGAVPKNETLRNSWLDIAGYSLIAMMLVEGVFTLPLECDL